MGRPYQHFWYSPFGEELVSQHSGSAWYDSPYHFNAKEVDPETGYHYYGARYYNSNLSIWLSVNPLADHPNQVDKSPYAYAWNNPVNLTDPDGRCPFCPWLDAVVDVGFIVYDIGVLAQEKITTGKTSAGNWAALGADAASIAVPMAVGAGLAARAAYKATSASSKALKAGKWVNVSENMSDAAASFQKQISGVDAGKSFKLNDEKFDGVTDGGILLDAKSAMKNFVGKDGNFQSWFKGAESMVDQAKRQLNAADGAPIQWHFENKVVL